MKLLLPSKHFSLSLLAHRSQLRPHAFLEPFTTLQEIVSLSWAQPPPPSCSKQPCPPFTKSLVLWWWHLSACAAFLLRSFPAPTDVLDNKRPTGPFFFRRLSRKSSFEHLTPHFSISPLVLRGPDSNRPRGPARRVLTSTTRLLHESADSTFFSRASSGHHSFFDKPTNRTPQSSPSTQFPSSPSISPDSAHSAPFSHQRQRHNSSSAERWL